MSADSDARSARIEARRQCLLTQIATLGWPITADGRITETHAAALLAMSPSTLRHAREAGDAPPSFARPLGRARRTYAVDDLAAWVEAAREDPATENIRG